MLAVRCRFKALLGGGSGGSISRRDEPLGVWEQEQREKQSFIVRVKSASLIE